MSIFSGRNPNATWGTCARCGHPMIIRKEGQKYGRVCAKKMATQTYLSALDRVDATDAGGEPGNADIIEVKNEKGEVTAVIV